jgi:hypothetical protein
MAETEDEIKRAVDQAAFRERIEGKIDRLFSGIGEVGKDFSEFKHGMGSRIDDMQKIIQAHAVEMPKLHAGVDDWWDTKRWLVRIVVGAVIAALLGLVLIKK